MPEVAPLPQGPLSPEQPAGDRDSAGRAAPPSLAWADRDGAMNGTPLPPPEYDEDEGANEPPLPVVGERPSVEVECALPVFYFGGAPGETNCSEAGRPRLHRRIGNSDFVSPKIGTRECGAVGQVSRNTQFVREDTEARARSVHQRQQCDTVGVLLGGSELFGGRRRSSSVGAVADPRSQGQDNLAGRFLYRARDAGQTFEVEAQLPGGRLLRVSRNPLRRTLTFEGEADLGQGLPGCWSAMSSQALNHRELPQQAAEERLVVRIPPGFDLMGPPAHVERAFSEGRCLVALYRCSSQQNEQALSWGAGEL